MNTLDSSLDSLNSREEKPDGRQEATHFPIHLNDALEAGRRTFKMIFWIAMVHNSRGYPKTSQ